MKNITHLPINGVRIPLVAAPTSVAAADSGWSSTNWSGYAIFSQTKLTYDSVSAAWIVPAVQGANQAQPTSWWTTFIGWLKSLFGAGEGESAQSSANNTYSATWIGIDGFNNNNLIQTGTAQNIVNGRPQYYAWWEILPNPETPIDSTKYPVSAGDEVVAHITKQDGNAWQVTLGNRTKGWVFHNTNLTYTGPGASAEWIEEAPQVNGSPTTLANYGEVQFTHLLLNGKIPNLLPADRGVMVQHGQQISTPSESGQAGSGQTGNEFSIEYGSATPSS